MPFLYVVKSGDYYKIGIAGDMVKRISSLQTGNPIPLEIVTCYEFNDPMSVERALHQKFSEKQEILEWFSLSKSDVEEIENICLLLNGTKYNSDIHISDKQVREADDFGDTIESLGLDLPDGAWLERKYNKEKTLSYLRAVWRDNGDIGEDGKPKRKSKYIRRLGGKYKRRIAGAP